MPTKKKGEQALLASGCSIVFNINLEAIANSSGYS